MYNSSLLVPYNPTQPVTWYLERRHCQVTPQKWHEKERNIIEKAINDQRGDKNYEENSNVFRDVRTGRAELVISWTFEFNIANFSKKI